MEIKQHTAADSAAKEAVSRGISRYFGTNEKGKTPYDNLRDAKQAVIMGRWWL